MRFKISASLIAILFLSVSVFAQDLDYEIEIFLTDTSIEKAEKSLPVKVKISNKAEAALRIDQLGAIHFSFSKCLAEKNCESKGDIYRARFESLPTRKIRQDESFEFFVNLADQRWYSERDRTGRLSSERSISRIPVENIYFYAQVRTLDGYKTKNMGPSYDSNGKLIKYEVKKIPNYRIVSSNLINVVFR